MAEILKCAIDYAILRDFPSQAETKREKAHLRDGTDCVQFHVVYLSITFFKKLKLI